MKPILSDNQFLRVYIEDDYMIFHLIDNPLIIEGKWYNRADTKHLYKRFSLEEFHYVQNKPVFLIYVMQYLEDAFNSFHKNLATKEDLAA